MIANRKPPARIFISYRRDDTRWIAGRLIDSLRAYFGEDRVFRDIEGIQGGAQFGDVIQKTMATADAVIVLIGPDWLDARDDEGKRRLDDPSDWVAREIAAALARGVPVYPVLVENARIPRVDDLPQNLRSLTDRNAISLADQRWESDVMRLAKIVAIDIPGSVAERTLNLAKWLICLMLLVSVTFTTGRVVQRDFSQTKGATLGIRDTGAPSNSNEENRNSCPAPPLQLLQFWETSITWLAIIASAIMLLLREPLVDRSRRIHIRIAGYVGLTGALIFFALILPVEPEAAETMISYLGSTMTATAMLMFMVLSGFKTA